MTTSNYIIAATHCYICDIEFDRNRPEPTMYPLSRNTIAFDGDICYFCRKPFDAQIDSSLGWFEDQTRACIFAYHMRCKPGDPRQDLSMKPRTRHD